MKKIITLSIFLVFLLFQVKSQDSISHIDNFQIENKNSMPILPIKGEFSLGLSMTPILNYFGNFFNGTSNNSLSAQFMSYPFSTPPSNQNSLAPSSSQVFLKYFLTDKTALRIGVEYTGVNFYNKVYVQDDAAALSDPLKNTLSEDMVQSTGSTIIISGGYEKRRGNSRVQGYYGGNAFYLRQNFNEFYFYSNPISSLNPNPTSHDWGNNLLANDGRKTAQYDGVVNGFGVGGFIGIEYFIFPKISIGAELGYSYVYSRQDQSSYEYEIWNVSEAETKTTIESPGFNNNSWGTNNPSANFCLLFHF